MFCHVIYWGYENWLLFVITVFELTAPGQGRGSVECVYVLNTSAHDLMRAALTNWGRVTHICVGKLTIIGSDNGLSPVWRQAIIWTNAGILLIGSLRTNFTEIWIRIETFSFKKMHLKMLSAKWCPFCLSLSALTHWLLGDLSESSDERFSC